MSAAAAAEQEGAPVADRAFSHKGKVLDMAGLALKNAILGLLTLTLYRFWARSAVRRRVWSRAWLMGDPLEYTGTGWELFRGFLIALPCFFLPAIFVFYVAPFAMDPAAAAWLTLGFYLFVLLLFGAARYWMRRYQMSRTRWRGVRLGLDGSAWSFAIASFGWSILESLTLGWYGPAARMRRARLLWENARFGDQPFEFAKDEYEPAKGLWWPFALGWFGVIPAFLLAAIISAMVMAALGLGGLFMAAPDPTATPNPLIVVGPLLMIVLTVLFWMLFQAPYQAAAMNRVAELISIDGARFRLRAKTFSLFGVTLASALIFWGSLTLLAPVAGMIQVRYVLNRLEMVGAPRFAEIGQPVIAAPRSGESIADAFDLDLGVGLI